jgi:hypothetical protein
MSSEVSLRYPDRFLLIFGTSAFAAKKKTPEFFGHSEL